MGFFDRFKMSASAPGPEPDVPADGEIITYDHAEQVGAIELESGATVEFTFQECVDFHPNIGTPVVVEELERRATGIHAVRVVLGDASRELEAIHAALVGERLAVEPDFALHTAEEAAACGAATLLLARPLRSEKALRQWFQACAPGVTIVGGPETKVQLEGLEARLLVGTAPMPATVVDYSECGPEFEPGEGFVTVVIDASPQPSTSDEGWAEGGRMRSLTRLVAFLARRATGVVIHAANHCVHPSRAWRQSLGNLNDPAYRPIEAWTRLAVVGRGDTLALVGMGIAGLPDVETVLVDDGGVGQEALREATRQMVYEGRVFGFRDTLTVPIPGDVAKFEVVFVDKTRVAIAPA